MNILFIKLGALGDVINTLPLAVALKKKPGVKIHWLVAPLSFPLVSNHSAVDKTIIFDKNDLLSSFSKVKKEFNKTRYDIVLDLQRTLKSGLFTMIAKSDRKIGFDKKRCKEMTWIFPFERIKPGNPNSHMLSQYMEFAEYLGYDNLNPVWDIPVFSKHSKKLPEKYVILNTGATKPANKWLPVYFAELADYLHNEKNIKSILTGGPDDIQFSDEVAYLSKTNPLNMTGKTSVGELSEIIKDAVLTVSCDTGPMHLAVANGTKIIALFGPSNPERTGPYKGTVINKKLHCSPCNQKNCTDPECMANITPDDVFAEIEKII